MAGLIAKTPRPPYFAVIFTSLRAAAENGYGETAAKMAALAAQQKGYLGVESAREDVGITVSYWADLDSIKQWKRNVDHAAARKRGRSEWYSAFSVRRVAKVEREYRARL